MKARPILFSGSMIRALWDGRKTQTRRLLKIPAPPQAVDAGVFHAPGKPYHGQWSWLDSKELEWATPIGPDFRCPYGVPSDLLWVRENAAAVERPHDGRDLVVYEADGSTAGIENTKEAADRWLLMNTYDQKRRPRGSMVPCIHMPRWASRLTLELTDVRVQRLQDISEEDAKAEGLQWIAPTFGVPGLASTWHGDPRLSYFALWSEINGEGSAEANPWVWALTFEVHKRNISTFAV